MQHAAGDRRAGSSERGEPQFAGRPAGGDGEPPGVSRRWRRRRRRGAGEEQHHPTVAGEDRAGAERGTSTSNLRRTLLLQKLL